MVEVEYEILHCSSLEELMTVLKVSLPSLQSNRLEDVIKQAASLNITRQLHTYGVEYQVLQEEQSSSKSQLEEAKKMIEDKNKEIKKKDTLLATRDSAILTLRAELAQKDIVISQLKEQLEDKNGSNNNNDVLIHDRLMKVLNLVEQVKNETDGEVR